MEDILQWKDMWHEQVSVSKDLDQMTDSFIYRLNKVEQKAKWKRTILIAAAILTGVLALILTFVVDNKYYVATTLLIGIAISYKMYYLYRTKYQPLQGMEFFDNKNYVDNQIILLKKKLDFNQKHLIIYMTLIIVALNIVLLGLYEEGKIFDRLSTHLSTLVLFGIAYWVNTRRMKGNKIEVQLLIDELKSYAI